MKNALILIVMALFIGLAFYLTETGPKKEIEANPPPAQNHKRQIPVETVLLHCGSIDRRLHLNEFVFENPNSFESS